jgi:hypothetical protein
MNRITISVKESKTQFILELLKNFNFVTLEEETQSISKAHKKIIDEELDFLKKNPTKTISLSSFKKNAKKHLK